MSNGALDNLAMNGIIDFDADAYIKGTTPRYVGNPGSYNQIPFEAPIPAMHSQPPADMYLQHPEQNEGHGGHDPFAYTAHKSTFNWKAGLLGAITVGLGTFGAVKWYQHRKAKLAKKQAQAALNAQNAANAANATNTASNTTTNTAKKSILDRIKSLGTTIKTTWQNKIPKWGKITAGVVGGLALLYGVFKLFFSPKAPVEMQQQEFPPANPRGH